MQVNDIVIYQLLHSEIFVLTRVVFRSRTVYCDLIQGPKGKDIEPVREDPILTISNADIATVVVLAIGIYLYSSDNCIKKVATFIIIILGMHNIMVIQEINIISAALTE